MVCMVHGMCEKRKKFSKDERFANCARLKLERKAYSIRIFHLPLWNRSDVIGPMQNRISTFQPIHMEIHWHEAWATVANEDIALT